jgi:hypothetical protein
VRSKTWLGSVAKGDELVAATSAANNGAVATRRREMTGKIGFMGVYQYYGVSPKSIPFCGGAAPQFP